VWLGKELLTREERHIGARYRRLEEKDNANKKNNERKGEASRAKLPASLGNRAKTLAEKRREIKTSP